MRGEREKKELSTKKTGKTTGGESTKTAESWGRKGRNPLKLNRKQTPKV